MPEMAALVKAMAIAELEIDNRYDESRHDGFFAGFDERALAPSDLELFPAYLVCLGADGGDGAERAALTQALTSGLPLKLLVQSDDILGPPSPGAGRFSLAAEGVHLAAMAVGLGGAFVLQSSASNLYQSRARLVAGMRFAGPALFSIFSGAGGHPAGLPPYLVAAAAMQSRAFPSFGYDPGLGAELASRASIDDNPQAERAWPHETLHYEDREQQRRADDLAFTFVDFVAGDGRYAEHLARVPESGWEQGLTPVAEYLGLADEASRADKVPYVLMVDGDGVLHRVIVAEALIQGARRCAERWRGLQELGGVDNSHARRLLEHERERWEEEKKEEIAALRRELAAAPQAAAAPPPPAGQAVAPEAAAATAAEPAPEAEPAEPAEPAPSDEAYIETPRCTTCDECTNLNKRMFAYDDNKQAYIADLSAGTYRDLVEAAEACQVAIIHPGKPSNPDEPGLDDLIKRAEAFN